MRLTYIYAIVVVVIVLLFMFIDMRPFINGPWVTPPIFSKATGKLVYLYIKDKVGYVIVQNGSKLCANHAVALDYPKWKCFRTNIQDFRIPVTISPAVDFGEGERSSIFMSIMIKGGKIVLFDEDDSIITVLQKEATDAGDDTPKKDAVQSEEQ